MSRSVALLIGLAVGAYLAKFAAISHAQQPQQRTIPGWGAVVNPDGDCTIGDSGGKLTFKVPGGIHDLWVGRPEAAKRFNAPRVLQEVEGNFTVQVKVTADWKLAPQATTAYHGAGLCVWESGQQYVRQERNQFLRATPPIGTFSYVCPLYDQNGRRVYTNVSRGEFFKGRSTWLRIVRSGNNLLTAISHDGKEWTSTGDLATEFGNKVQVGVHAVSTTNGDFVVDFEEFKLTKANPAVSDNQLLNGTWVCLITLKDRKAVDAYVGARAVIDGDNLTWMFPTGDGKYHEQKCKFRIDAAQQPKHFDWWREDKPEAVEQRLYALSGDELRWSTNLDYKTRPASIDSGVWQFTMKRVQPVK